MNPEPEIQTKEKKTKEVKNADVTYDERTKLVRETSSYLSTTNRQSFISLDEYYKPESIGTRVYSFWNQQAQVSLALGRGKKKGFASRTKIFAKLTALGFVQRD